MHAITGSISRRLNLIRFSRRMLVGKTSLSHVGLVVLPSIAPKSCVCAAIRVASEFDLPAYSGVLAGDRKWELLPHW
ncbi:MAG: hypothetical protein DMG30_07425 [Acidobacteria bacterium]|nr:MAG: hypothetical protein DMG30_07425 [Acidobacteriota bacterium]